MNAVDTGGEISAVPGVWEMLLRLMDLFGAQSLVMLESESMSFSAEASDDQDGYIVSYHWDFGDGDTDTGINVEHTYSLSGHYIPSHPW